MAERQAQPMSITCERLEVRYGSLVVARDITLEATAGEVLAVLGPNGAGKTSLLRGLAGLASSRGKIHMAGTRIDTLPPHARARRGLALVPEVRGNLFPDLTVADNLAAALLFEARAEHDERVHEVTDLFPKLGRMMAQRAQTLSGGEQQMLAIAVALLRRPAVLLLDEPSQGLAPAVLDQIEETVSRLHERDMAIVLSEQNLAFASALADRFVVIRGGSIVARGTAEAMADREELAAAYLSGTAVADGEAQG